MHKNYWDESDIQTDYFNQAFFGNLYLGSYDKLKFKNILKKIINIKVDNVAIIKQQKKFTSIFQEILENEIQNKGTRRLTLCQSYQELMEVDRTSQERREDRQAERNELFNLIHARDILGLISYRDYIIQDKKILDCDR